MISGDMKNPLQPVTKHLNSGPISSGHSTRKEKRLLISNSIPQQSAPLTGPLNSIRTIHGHILKKGLFWHTLAGIWKQLLPLIAYWTYNRVMHPHSSTRD